MRQLRMPAKFSLIVLTLLIPLAMLSYLYVEKTNEDIDFAGTELAGVAYQRVVNPLTEAVLRLRGQLLLELLGMPDPAAATAARNDVAQRLTQLEQAVHGEDRFALSAQFGQVKQAWSVASAARYTDTMQITAGFSTFDKALTGLRRQVSERSELALDPDVDTYYLMLAATEKLPAAVINLAPLRGLVTFSAARPEQAEALRVRIAAYMALLHSELDDTRDALARVDKASPALLARLDRGALAATEQYLAQVETGIMAGRAAAPAALFAAGSEAMAASAALTASGLDRLEQALESRVERLRLRRNAMLGGVLLALTLATYALLSFFLAARGGFHGMAERLARLGRGDLTASKPSAGRDEIAESINLFSSSIDTLGTIVHGVRESAEAINLATAEIAAGNGDLAERGVRIADAVQRTAANMDALAARVGQNLDNARQADALARSAFAVAGQGEAVVLQAVGMMEKITLSSRRIGDIIAVIDGIAFQTNILALNAAVEAARAGEQGRGFAVVASEVRNLSQRSAAAAREIGQLIRDSIGDIDAGARFVNEAGATMQDILSSVQRVTGIMDAIATDSHAQSGEIQTMAVAVRDIDASTQENAAMVEQISAALMSLEERAGFLSESVRAFKTEADAPLKQLGQRSGMRLLPA